MPPLNTTLIRGCSELQGPATQEWLWHGSDFVAPSLCSLLGPITPHRSFLPSFFLELFWWEGWMKVRRLRREGAMDALALPAAEMSDRGTEDSGYGPPRSKRARKTHWAFATSWSDISRVLARHWFSGGLSGGVFFICATSCLSHLVVNSEDPGFASELWCIFFLALHVVCFGMLSPHINTRVP